MKLKAFYQKICHKGNNKFKDFIIIKHHLNSVYNNKLYHVWIIIKTIYC